MSVGRNDGSAKSDPPRGKLVGTNSLEGVIVIAAGLTAGSIALAGFGFDSVIEVISGLALLRRLYADVNEEKRAHRTARPTSPRSSSAVWC